MPYIKQPSEFTEGENLLILTPQSVHTPGDERSRTNPGHGYSASTDYYWNVQRFDSREEWEAEIADLTKRKREFVPIAGTKPNVVTVTTVSVD